MGLNYENLDDETRKLMVSEIAGDMGEGRSDASAGLYLSSYLNDSGVREWPRLLMEAASTGSDDSLAYELNRIGCFKTEVQRRRPSGGYTMARVPYTAATTLAESQFNMYYIRALAVRALDVGVGLVVYRAKTVDSPRSTSEAMIGQTLDPGTVLHALRATKGVEPTIGVPMPNTGITARLGPK